MVWDGIEGRHRWAVNGGCFNWTARVLAHQPSWQRSVFMVSELLVNVRDIVV